MNYSELLQQAQQTMRNATIQQTRVLLAQLDNVDSTRAQLATAKRNHHHAIQRLTDAVMVLSGVKWYRITVINDAIQHAVDCAIECRNYGVGVVHYEQAYNNAKTNLLNSIITYKRNNQQQNNKQHNQQQNGGK